MPLVHIHVIAGRRTPAALRTLCDVVHDVMRHHFGAPERDRYQIVTEHASGTIIALDSGLAFDRSDDIVILQITQQGRSSEQKQSMYRAMATQLSERAGLNGADLVISVTENGRADWSFGFGGAQFLDGRL